MIQLVTIAAFTVFLILAVLSPRAGAGRLAVGLAILALPVLALAQSLDGNTIVGFLPVSDRAKANVAYAWLAIFYLAGLLKRWIPSHTIVGKALDFVTQDTRPPTPRMP